MSHKGYFKKVYKNYCM